MRFAMYFWLGRGPVLRSSMLHLSGPTMSIGCTGTTAVADSHMFVDSTTQHMYTTESLSEADWCNK